MDFKVNSNDFVKVKLKESGIAILKEKRDELNKMIHANGGKGLGEYKLKVDEEGYSKFQLWELMNTFGHLMGLGLETPFETDIIVTKGKLITE